MSPHPFCHFERVRFAPFLTAQHDEKFLMCLFLRTLTGKQ